MVMNEKMIKIFETHAHYNDRKFDKDRDELLRLVHNQGIDRIVNISYDRNSIFDTLKLSKKYDFIYSVIGYHPCDCKDIGDDEYNELIELSKDDKVVAIGEIGLDYYWDSVPKEVQKKSFIEQMNIAKKVNLPIVVHSREAAKDTYEYVKKYGCGKGVIHCYSYSYEMAREFIKLGYYIGVGGVLTFKNSKNIKEVVERIDISSIVIETDCPYLAPEPFRGKRNHSAYLIYVLETIANIKGMALQEVGKIIYENSMRLYEIES